VVDTVRFELNGDPTGSGEEDVSNLLRGETTSTVRSRNVVDFDHLDLDDPLFSTCGPWNGVVFEVEDTDLLVVEPDDISDLDFTTLKEKTT
jgi:hypothetical protein